MTAFVTDFIVVLFVEIGGVVILWIGLPVSPVDVNIAWLVMGGCERFFWYFFDEFFECLVTAPGVGTTVLLLPVVLIRWAFDADGGLLPCDVCARVLFDADESGGGRC